MSVAGDRGPDRRRRRRRRRRHRRKESPRRAGVVHLSLMGVARARGGERDRLPAQEEREEAVDIAPCPTSSTFADLTESCPR